MRKLIIDSRMRKIEKDKLKELGFELIEIKPSENVYEEISSHVDIFTCKIGNTIVIEPSKYAQIIDKIENTNKNIKKGREKISSKYPEDIKYNVCIIGKKAIHNFEFTDLSVKEELESHGYELIPTTQGYTNCSIAVIDDNSAIVTDKGLYKILQKHNIDVIFIKEPDIKLLTRKGFSDKKGFIGGVITRIEDSIIVTGDLRKIDIDDKIREFIERKNLKIIDFKDLDVIDYGGILEI